ncbi:MAG: biotin transporter BioY [Thermoprotei archaeon]
MDYPYVVLSIAMAVLTGLLAQVRLVVGPIPYTLQNVAVVLAGIILKPKYAFMSMVLYLVLIVVGVPVASGFRGGLSVLLGYTGGYLAGFAISAPLMSMLTRLYLRLTNKEIREIGVGDALVLLTLSFIAMIPAYVLGFLVFTYYALGSQAVMSWVERVIKYLNISLDDKLLQLFVVSVAIFIPQDLLMDHVLAITLAKYLSRILTYRGLEL